MPKCCGLLSNNSAKPLKEGEIEDIIHDEQMPNQSNAHTMSNTVLKWRSGTKQKKKTVCKSLCNTKGDINTYNTFQ